MRAFFWACCLGVALLAACASEVRRIPVDLVSTVPDAGRRWACTATLELLPESGYRRTIAAGTEFVAVGRVAQGLVLKPTQTVLTLEGAHMHEAYVVLHDGQFVGFYLPVERAYAALPRPVPAQLQEKP